MNRLWLLGAILLGCKPADAGQAERVPPPPVPQAIWIRGDARVFEVRPDSGIRCFVAVMDETQTWGGNATAISCVETP